MQAKSKTTVAILGGDPVAVNRIHLSWAALNATSSPLLMAITGAQSPNCLAHPSFSTPNARIVEASFNRDAATAIPRFHVDDPSSACGTAVFTAKGNGAALPDGTPPDNSIVIWHSDKTETMILQSASAGWECLHGSLGKKPVAEQGF